MHGFRNNHAQSRTSPQSTARHRLHDRRGVHIFDHGRADETNVGALWTAADRLPEKPLIAGLPGAADRMAALLDDAQGIGTGAACLSRTAWHHYACEFRIR